MMMGLHFMDECPSATSTCRARARQVRQEDVQVHGQRHRSAGDDRAVRHRRLPLHPHRLCRPGSRDPHGRGAHRRLPPFHQQTVERGPLRPDAPGRGGPGDHRPGRRPEGTGPGSPLDPQPGEHDDQGCAGRARRLQLQRRWPRPTTSSSGTSSATGTWSGSRRTCSATIPVRDQARGVLLTVLEQVLKLMHPITPFVTEEIWSRLPGERTSIMVEPFPEANPAWADPAAESAMDLVMGVISGLRTHPHRGRGPPERENRGAHPLPRPGQARPARGARGGHRRHGARRQAGHRGDRARRRRPRPGPGRGVGGAAQGADRRGRRVGETGQEQAKLDKELARIVAKLGNDQFMANAPAAVVAKERDKEAEVRARLAKALESSQRLNKLC